MRVSIFILMFLCGTAYAHDVIVSENGKEIAKVKITWSFVDADTGASALVARAVLPLKNGEHPLKVSGDGIFWKPTWVKHGKMLIGVGALHTKMTVEYSRGAKREYDLRLNLSELSLVEEGCKTVGLKVKAVKPPAFPIFMGVRCVKKADRVNLQMSVPQEVEWDTTSIFEVNGKGERWKVYELSAANLMGEKNTVGEFSFRLGEGTFSYALVQTRMNGKESARPRPPEKAFVKLRLGVGLAQLSSKTPLLPASGVGPLLSADLYTLPVFWNVRSTAEMKFVAPLSGHQYYEYSLGLGPAFAMGADGFLMVAGEYLGVGQDEEVGQSTISLRHNQIGVALNGRFGGGDSFYGLLLRYNGLGGESTHLALGGDYESRLKDRNQFWGISLRYQMQSAKSTTGTSTFGQIILAGTYRF